MADVDIDIAANLGNTNSTLNSASQGLGSLGDAANSASGDLDGAGSAANAAEGKIQAVGAGALGASAAFANMEGIVQSSIDLWNTGERRADELARAELDVEQAAADMEQATLDAAQAQIDINQAQADGVQAGIDLEQALLDQEQAQTDYNDAVKEFGKGSIEARQAALDLKQADADAGQAKLDATQATEDYKQAQLDGKQATIDAKGAQLDLNEAQRNVTSAEVMGGWFGVVSQVGTALFGLIGTFALFGASTVATAATAVASAVSTAVAWVGSWVSMAATSLVSAASMAAAWLLSIWPIALIIAAVVGLTVLIIKNWDTIKAWTIKIFNAVWTWLKGLWDDIIGLFNWAVGVVKYIFFNFSPLGIIIKNWGKITSWVSNQWSNIAKIVSGWVNRIGGFFSGMWDGVVSGLKWALNGVIGTLNNGIYGINTLIVGANRIPGVNISQIPYIPFLAAGGVTTGPTMAMIGEGREQEAVLPLSKLQGMLDMAGNGSAAGVVIEFKGGSRAFREFFQESVRTTTGRSVTKYAGG
ncbi:tape measure protein [Streptomyces phage phiRKBJ001]|nr:tape measure protein [Streptomyces phage phiRKBJ001]